MRIDGIFNPEHLSRPNGKPSASKSKSSEARGADAGDGLEKVSAHQSLIQAALAAEEVDYQAVEKARQALEDGQLDTPQAARRAAQAMIDLGF